MTPEARRDARGVAERRRRRGGDLVAVELEQVVGGGD
jgi:hypothetical protein